MNGTAELTDGVATIIVVVIDVIVQPDQEDILDHLNIDASMCNCIFGMSRGLFCFRYGTGMASCY
jgi:hypothetical protein